MAHLLHVIKIYNGEIFMEYDAENALIKKNLKLHCSTFLKKKDISRKK